MSSISRFHIQIIQLFAFVFVWVHWDACLQYGACTSQLPSRYTQPTGCCHSVLSCRQPGHRGG